MSTPREAALRLDPETLDAVAARLRAAGGCDRAVGVVEEMRRGAGAQPRSGPPALDTRMGCVERAIKRRRVST